MISADPDAAVPEAESKPSTRVPLRRAGRETLVWLLLGAIVLVSTALIVLASRRNSVTFDEIVPIAVGARGYVTGEFDLAPDHPPLMQYLYGAPVYLDGATYPDESGVSPELKRSPAYRYLYAQHFFFTSGNDPERVALLGRLPAALVAAVLVLLVFAYTRSLAGAGAGLLAAALAAFLPDVLAHGGVAYNDLPVAAAFLAGVWALDRAVRRPTWRAGLLVGVLAGIGVGLKISAGVLLPVGLGLLALEGFARRHERTWLRGIAVAVPVALAAGYLTLVAIYRGDWLLEQFRYGLSFRAQHLSGGHGARQILLGGESPSGWWYFFPIAFLFKTPAGLHMLMVLAAFGFVRSRATLRRIAASPLRAPALAMIVFGAGLLASNLNIGFRYALPLMPPLIVLTAVGARRAWPALGGLGRAVAAVAVAAALLMPITHYPNFLSYVSEYGPGRDRGHRVLVDSSLDWGQGLIQLREYLDRNDIDAVYLSYFGSALPAGYGIRYVPLHSFFPLPPQPPLERDPEYVVISATNLRGAYFPSDPYASFRHIRPEAVVAGTLHVFRVGEEAR